MAATALLRMLLAIAVAVLFSVFYSMGRAYTGWGRLLAVYGFAVLLIAAMLPRASKALRSLTATFLLLAGVLPFGLTFATWQETLIVSAEIAAVSGLVVLIFPTGTYLRRTDSPNR
jgi:hypothetical protein